jgi:hypothetical protein
MGRRVKKDESDGKPCPGANHVFEFQIISINAVSNKNL